MASFGSQVGGGGSGPSIGGTPGANQAAYWSSATAISADSAFTRTSDGVWTCTTSLTSATLVATTEVLSPIARGSAASGGTLTLKSTSHATKGKVIFGTAGTTAYDEVNDRFGIGTASPAVALDVVGAGQVSTTFTATTSVTSAALIGTVSSTAPAARSTVTTAAFATAAIASNTAIHAAYNATAANTWTGVFTNPDCARRLCVVFGAGWDGGNVTVTGTDAFGVALSETFTAAAGTTVNGKQYFFTATSATKVSVGTTGTASIGTVASTLAISGVGGALIAHVASNVAVSPTDTVATTTDAIVASVTTNGTPATSFATGIVFRGQTSVSASEMDLARIQARLTTTGTNPSAQVDIYVASATNLTKVFTVDANGSILTNNGFQIIKIDAGTASARGGIGSTSGGHFNIFANSTSASPQVEARTTGDVVIGLQSALATNATAGQVWLRASAGTPTGVPANPTTGMFTLQFDTTNKKLYIWDPVNTTWFGGTTPGLWV